MRIVRCCLFLSCLIAAGFSSAQDWQPITPQDLQIKEVPGDPGASAIQLYYADYIDDNMHNEFIYSRIKILTDKGTQYADVEIPVLIPHSSIGDFKARTIHSDGKIVEFSGKPFEKTIIKGRGVKYLAKTFTFPEATVGSIIEYKFKVYTPEDVIYDNSWTIQHSLYTVKESFRIKGYTGQLETKHGGSSGLSMVYSNMPSNIKPQRKGEGFELEVQNEPAFHSEEYMPPEGNYKPQVRFFYGGSEITSADKFWDQAGHDWNEQDEKFIGNHSEIKAAAAEAIGNEEDWDKQVRKLYARAQQIRNLTYERGRSKEEMKKEGLKDNQNVVDVLKRGYGDRQDIMLFFVAMARASGFRTSVLRVSDRKNRFFDKGLLSMRQMNTELAVVKINGEDVYLDPGTKFCPYGFVRWIRTSTAALKLDKSNVSFIQVPTASFERALLHRDAKLTLNESGDLNGDLTVQYEGGEALERRLDALETDEAGRNKDLETEVKSWLPSTAIVKLKDVQGWRGTDDPLTAQFSIQIPGYASAAGKRLLLPPYLFQAKQKDAFKHADRKYPVYFAYCFSEKDVISIKTPAGYSIEGGPQTQQTKLSYAAYQNVGEFSNGQLVTQRNLYFNGIYIDLDRYAEVKDFFNKVQAGDEQQAVLHVGGTSSASKGN
ncbi:MAG TPA: DUF3857 domain-containing protein [Candidatus Angelobacter sp.]